MKSNLEAALLQKSMGVLELTRALGISVEELQAELRACSSIHNVGTEEYPVWAWKIGNRTSREFLLQRIRQLLAERPMSQHLLVAATGADAMRVARAINELAHCEELTVFSDGETIHWSAKP